MDVYVHRGRRGLVDWLNALKASIPCFTTGQVTLQEWSWVFFEYSQSIPIYAGITLDLSVGAGAFLKIVASLEACVFQLTARGEVGPQAGVDVYASVSIAIILVRAGVKIRVLLFATTLTAGAEVGFAEKPMSLCFDLKYSTEPLSAEFYAFVQIRNKIKWCKVWGGFKLPCGLDWGTEWSILIGSADLSVGTFGGTIFEWCNTEPNGLPQVTAKTYYF